MTGCLIDRLTEDHRLIRARLDALGGIVLRLESGRPAEPGEWLEFLRFAAEFIRGDHHRREEEELFPALREAGLCDQGGPHCTLFMGHWIESAPTRQVDEAIRDARPRSSPPSPGMLSIPLEEHAAGARALDAIRELHPRTDPASRARLAEVARAYLHLMHWHIRKEDECLFAMARERLTAPFGARARS